MNSLVVSSLCSGLTLSEFYVFDPLKGSLRGHFYVGDKALWDAAHQWVQRKESNFYEVGICAVVERMKKNFDRDGCMKKCCEAVKFSHV